MKILPSVWGSVVVLCNQIIADAKIKYPDVAIEFVDWETHANIPELPDKDLIGPTALTITELSPQMFEVSFAIAVSSYASDNNLFRMRHYLSEIFDKLRVNKQLKIYDSETAEALGFLIFTGETLLAPMSRAETRPWQYVQVSGLLEPVLT